MSRIAITGLGVVSAAGVGVAEVEAALRADRSGLGRLTRFASPRCGELPVAQVEAIAEAPRAVALARPALKQALAQASLPSLDDVGLTLGCTVGGMPESEQAVAAELEQGAAPDVPTWLRHECGATTAALARAADLRGPTLTVSTACASGAQAIALGAELLLDGQAPAVVAGGADALCRLTLNGFASLLLVDPEGCRPFDAARRGMSLGEGAAFLVLERESVARARGAEVLGLLTGWATTCDAHHATAPDPEGAGAARALRATLEAAGRRPHEVDYVNAHGTGTPDNDRAEAAALRAVFGEVPPVSSSKRVFGHTLGAAGAIEALATLVALRGGFLPGTPGLETPDPGLGLTPLRAACPAAARVALSDAFGFGGTNTVLCLELP